jgi:3-oxoacyl-[acyl-carrier protein] reductase
VNRDYKYCLIVQNLEQNLREALHHIQLSRSGFFQHRGQTTNSPCSTGRRGIYMPRGEIMRLRGRRALITGTATGIGRAIARRFASEGAEIIAVDRDEAGNQETADLIRKQAGSCTAFTADVSLEDDVVSVFRQAGSLNILVNNAASVEGDGRITDLSGQAWDKVLAVCLKSVFLCTREALVSMVPKKSGSIINLSSVNAIVGINLAAYTAAKGGIISFTKLTAAHHAADGIRANAICPGTILSESSAAYYAQRPEIEAGLRALYPAGEFGNVEDIAACALFLASDEAAFINGVALSVDGGLTTTRPFAALNLKQS